MFTKTDPPGPFNCYAKAHDDEPMFILLGRDPVAGLLVDLWVAVRTRLGVTDPDKLQNASLASSALIAYSLRSPDGAVQLDAGAEAFTEAILSMADQLRARRAPPAEAGRSPVKQPPKSYFYSARNPRTWAHIFLTDNGVLSIVSAHGAFGYWWTDTDCEFRRFLCDCERDYITDKLARGRKQYDPEATLVRVRSLLDTLDWPAARLAAERQLIQRLDDLHNEYSLHLWIEETTLDLGALEPIVRVPPYEVRVFMDQLWPRFVQDLRAELATEPAPVRP